MREAVQQIIYDQVITAVLRIINRLNLSSKIPFTADEVVCVYACECVHNVCVCLYICMCVF